MKHFKTSKLVRWVPGCVNAVWIAPICACGIAVTLTGFPSLSLLIKITTNGFASTAFVRCDQCKALSFPHYYLTIKRC